MDWGAHHIDIAQWIIDQCGPGQGPTTIKPMMIDARVPFDENGNPTLDDRYNTPHRFTVQVYFPSDVIMEITCEGRNLCTDLGCSDHIQTGVPPAR